MILKEMINELRKAKDANKLIVFVGAGVSKNSQIPTWGGLIEQFAKELGYDNCNNCSFQQTDCPLPDCRHRYGFSQDEYLKIPQYFYNIDNSENKSQYFRIINESLNVNAKPNLINDLIMKLYPKHIITTNYDKLIETTESPNSMMYEVIIRDKDLLNRSSNNYILKIHGDIDNPDTLVLKENDYLNYQQNHILMETFIKALLIDHTFLFIGYSLNDYNLKLIISWIENLAKQHDIKENRPRNFIIQNNSEQVSEYIKKYFNDSNIFIINTFELPKALKEKCSSLELGEQGKEVYATLDYILDEENDYLAEPLLDVLFNKYQIFEDQHRISFTDLLAVHSFGRTTKYGQLLFFYEKEKFKSLEQIIETHVHKANFIKGILIKAGVEAIQYEDKYVPIIDKVALVDSLLDELLDLTQSNNYTEILFKLDSINDEMIKAYYYHIICPHLGNCSVSMELAEKALSYSNDYFKLLQYKYNKSCIKQMQFIRDRKEMQEFEIILSNIPKSLKAKFGYFEKLYKGNYDNKLKCVQLYNKHEEIFTKSSNSVTLTNPELNSLELQAISYDYYYFFKLNNLMLDHFSNPKNFLEPYIKAVLCTYTPRKQRKRVSMFGYEPPLNEYVLTSTDLDILIKFTDIKKLKQSIKEFSVRELKFDNNSCVIDKFINLCNSVRKFPNRFSFEYLNTYLYVLTKCPIDSTELNRVSKSLNDVLFNTDKEKGILLDILDEVIYFLNNFKNENVENFTQLLVGFLSPKVIMAVEDYRAERIEKVHKLLSNYSNSTINNKVNKLINAVDQVEQKVKMIYRLRFLLNQEQKKTFMPFVKNNLNCLGSEEIFNYIVEKFLEYDEIIENRYLEILQEQIAQRKNNPGVQTYPDWLVNTLEYLIILHLVGIDVSLEKISVFAEYSEPLEFILNPEIFDYSKVKTENYMWVNFIRNKKYLKILKKHRNVIAINLKTAISHGYATEGQKLMLYRFFLKDKEVSEYL